MTDHLRAVSTIAGLALAGCVGLSAQQAPARSCAARRRPAAARVAPVPSHATAVDRALVDKYCVTCHNEKLKTAGLILDKIDFWRSPPRTPKCSRRSSAR